MWPPRERTRREWLELPERPAAMVAGNLDDMERLLRLMGVPRMVWHQLRRVDVPRGRTVRLLDLATGSGWLLRYLAARARREGMSLQVVGVDHDREILELARQRSADEPALSFREADVRGLDRSWGAFDVVLCTMLLHHLEEKEVAQLLAAMASTAGHRWLACDLLRGAPALAMAWVASRLASRNPLTRHDGPLSVRRAYTLSELRSLVRGSVGPGARVIRWAGICAVASGVGGAARP